jgi:ATP-dependent Clp protease adaptor protein ClpS
MAEIKTKRKTKTKTNIFEPTKWNVIFYNDNKTPIDFVIAVLEEVFNYTSEKATEMTIRIHESKSQVVATYNYEIAEQKTTETLMLARNFGYPFRCEMVQE